MPKKLSHALVVLTRGVGDDREWKDYLISLGASIYHFPTIETITLPPSERVLRTLREIDRFDTVVFTSKNGVRAFTEISEKIGLDQTSKTLPPAATVGAETKHAAENAGFKVTFVPSTFNARTLADEIPLTPGKRLLLLRSTIAADEFPKKLTARGANITDLSLYETRSHTEHDPVFLELLRADKVSFLTFASSSAVRGFVARISKTDLSKARDLPAIAIGQSVAESLRENRFTNIHIAPSPDIYGIVSAMAHTAQNE